VFCPIEVSSITAVLALVDRNSVHELTKLKEKTAVDSFNTHYDHLSRITEDIPEDPVREMHYYCQNMFGTNLDVK
jgi:hypothetical protein